MSKSLNTLPSGAPRLLTITEAAAQLQISPRTLRRHIDAGEIKVVRIGRTVRIAVDALNDFIKTKTS